MSLDRHSTDEAPSGLSKLARAGALGLALVTGAANVGCATHSNSLRRGTKSQEAKTASAKTGVQANAGKPVTDEFWADISDLQASALEGLKAFDPTTCTVKSGGAMPTKPDMGASITSTINCPSLPIVINIERKQDCRNPQFESVEKGDIMSHTLASCMNATGDKTGNFGVYINTAGGLKEAIGLPSAEGMATIKQLTSAVIGTPVPAQVAKEIDSFRNKLIKGLEGVKRTDCKQTIASSTPTDPDLPVMMIDVGECKAPLGKVTDKNVCTTPTWTKVGGYYTYAGCREGGFTRKVVSSGGWVVLDKGGDTPQ
jgi:hypothetical protein